MSDDVHDPDAPTFTWGDVSCIGETEHDGQRYVILGLWDGRMRRLLEPLRPGETANERMDRLHAAARKMVSTTPANNS